MAEFTSYKKIITDFGIATGSFKNDNSEIVEYKQAVVQFVIDGKLESFVLSGGSAVKPRLLEALLKSQTQPEPLTLED